MTAVDLRLAEHPNAAGVFYGTAQLDDAVVSLGILPPAHLWQGYYVPLQPPDPRMWQVFADGELIGRIEPQEDVGPALLPLLESAYARACSRYNTEPET